MKNKISGLLGLWLIGLIFLDFSDTLFRSLLILTAVLIVVLSFWGDIIFRSGKELIEMENEKEDDNI